ncbi:MULTISPECIES: aldehyde dehydrogenase family protein [unclassified Colwellia]|jgi:aldehyde dehydrogenase (NAD+)|uniref:aldehyde dehydrogenase family protein n=1 Tax=unclassified Colwellia TaxID=196834 RepID=UPI0015F66229|nr:MULTISPECIES: aldehyde dehydrogenase family protein [unclassified Colwellia]MBA6362770.1 aldehyde dehydrogenase family protein [Colwellia sp. BRX8-8]MBA6349259.1 aldehyde dehydrogenase family protein [Colwellia sp. BRX8-9]MBA6353024.1 aldehyde dehydrogenase family protein [Colwellia sp. BRX9-1]MBA6356344.1 aldehyde dehydrogenase family protein [Colwellia sp. BRX8-3]MBA6359219.1 aldehyde dehydrogenase family protein [Colwellia sp. BRX8-6]
MPYQALLTKHSQYFDTNVTRDISWRKQQLQAIKKLVIENEKDILQALQDDLAKPTLEAWITEISYITSDVDHTCKHLNKWAKPRGVSTPIVVQPGKSFIKPEPQGTVLIIGAWNYPLQLVLAPLIAVIAAGNCAIIKPSELAPAISALIGQLIPKYLDNNAVSVVEGGVTETTALLTLNFDHIMYTGNGQVARIVMAAAAKHLTPVTLELGGKSPVYVDESADLTITAQRIAWGKWMNAGQTCIAPDYLLVKENLVEPLTLALKAQITAMFGENPKNSDSYGRIINQRHCQRIATYFNDGKIMVGGESDIESCYIAPTIIINPALDSPLMTEEIFGAILPIVTIEDFDQAKSFVKQREKPLSAYIFSRNNEQVAQWVNEISSGSQCINDVIMFNAVPDLPFGGTGPSGIGQYSGKAGFDNFSHLKSVLKRPFIKDIPVRFAPYSKWKLKFLRFIR